MLNLNIDKGRGQLFNIAQRLLAIDSPSGYTEQAAREVEQIARDFGISRSRLYASFYKYLGCGLAHYIRKLRMEKARTLLKDTDQTVSRIAALCGFSDYNYFCRIFKKENGLSAKKYRALYAGQPRSFPSSTHSTSRSCT